MSYHFVSKNEMVSVRKRTDGTQNYKNVAQGQAALKNAQVNEEKLKLAQLASEDKHEMHKAKFARESIKLEQEAKEYWNNLSDEEKKQIAGQMFVENQAQLRAYRDKNDIITDREKMNLKWQGLKFKSASFGEKVWHIVVIALILCVGLPIVLTIWYAVITGMSGHPAF